MTSTQASAAEVLLSGWGVREEVGVVTLPLPPHPHPLTLTTLVVPGLNAWLRVIRPCRDQAYPDERGVLRRDEAGNPHTLRLLGRDWHVLAQLDHGPAMEVDATLSGADLRRAATAALDALEAAPGGLS